MRDEFRRNISLEKLILVGTFLPGLVTGELVSSLV